MASSILLVSSLNTEKKDFEFEGSTLCKSPKSICKYVEEMILEPLSKNFDPS